MAITGAGFKWYDGFFLSMLAFSIIMVGLSWDHYHLCKLPLHLWISVDYAAVFVFRLLMFVDNAIAAEVRLDFGRQLRGRHFFGRIVVLSILYAVLYPFLWAWSVVGAVWFAGARNCLPEKNQKWGFLVWLLFSFCGLICLAGNFGKKWLTRRQAHLRRAPHGTRISEYRVLLNMIRQPDWVFETAGQEMRGIDQDAAPYSPGHDLSESQRTAVETSIQRLPVFILKAVPTDCSDCPICLEEFHVGQGVRGLPCAHNFHVACIDKWLRVNMKCPRCRCYVFPNLNLSNPLTTSVDSVTHHHVRIQPSSYLVRMQSFLQPVREEDGQLFTSSSPSSSSSSESPNPAATGFEYVENGSEMCDHVLAMGEHVQ
ncbi:E3 ubiquitin-protein ligase SIS3 [Lactuca sativa]|uniref:E3 ubiquitin-protein ligase SIS3 n=1 Tax=Lactuca sativa TaxID=4236 RepID=UPI000CD8707C|nr:E3 ubiquitin-protein ligase SIS3 [Lactuca sativa]